MYAQSLPVADPEYIDGDYKPATAYARSKRIQVSLLPFLAERWRPRDVSVHAMHPGWADTPGVVDSLPGFHKFTGPILRDVAQGGADTTVWLAGVEPTPEGGWLWHDRRPARPRPAVDPRERGRAPAMWAWVRQAAQLPR